MSAHPQGCAITGECIPRPEHLCDTPTYLIPEGMEVLIPEGMEVAIIVYVYDRRTSGLTLAGIGA